MESNEKAAMVIDHDTYFLDIVSDSVLVFQGEGGDMERPSGHYTPKGNEPFSSDVDVTRRDIESHRPRINKLLAGRTESRNHPVNTSTPTEKNHWLHEGLLRPDN